MIGFFRDFFLFYLHKILITHSWACHVHRCPSHCFDKHEPNLKLIAKEIYEIAMMDRAGWYEKTNSIFFLYRHYRVSNGLCGALPTSSIISSVKSSSQRYDLPSHFHPVSLNFLFSFFFTHCLHLFVYYLIFFPHFNSTSTPISGICLTVRNMTQRQSKSIFPYFAVHSSP